MDIERFDQLGEVGERAGQPIDLIDDAICGGNETMHRELLALLRSVA
jgi:hypothetical protein